MSTSEIAYTTRDYVAQLYADLFSGLPFAIIGFLVCLAGGCFAAYFLARRFGCEVGDKRIAQRILAAIAIVAACVVGLPRIDVFGGAMPFALACIVGGVAIYAFVRRPNAGAWLFVLFLIAYFAPICVGYGTAVFQDYNTINMYKPIAQISVFSSSNYLVFLILIIALWVALAAAIATWFAVDRHEGLPMRQRSAWYRGRHTDVKEGFKGSAGHGANKAIRKGAWTALATFAVLLLGIVPAKVSGGVSSMLTAGTSDISNAYVTVLNEYLEDSGVASDEKWYEGFFRASGDLYEADARFLSVNLRMLYGTYLYMYTLYSDASFDQMVAIEDIDDCVVQMVLASG